MVGASSSLTGDFVEARLISLRMMNQPPYSFLNYPPVKTEVSCGLPGPSRGDIATVDRSSLI